MIPLSRQAVLAALRSTHRRLGLLLAGLWALQAITGVMLVFHWEIDDWTVAGPARALQPAAFERSLVAIEAAHPGRSVSAVYGSAGRPDRYDVILDGAGGHNDVLRLDGGGEVLRMRPSNYDPVHMGVFQVATYLHQTLFAHQRGTWFIGLSGLVLLIDVLIGVKLAWPVGGRWAAALLPRPRADARAIAFAWHRAAGLWLALPATLLFAAGVLLAFEDPLAGWFDDARPPPTAASAASEPALGPVTFATAAHVASARYPGAALWAVEWPKADAPWYKVELRQAGEPRRAAGVTSVYVSSRSGRVLADYDAFRTPLKTRVWDALYAVHTGEIAGVAGRVLALVVGASLFCLTLLGVTLWWVRRRGRPKPRLAMEQAR
ncbi:hypothetical protein DJ021_10580 [Phenylobacterium hankyongense]|uniref:PepSY domain-containing protein n=1 Tax=Phenylobacterium hankyongense TaxID=1813876 RepID=A0A328B2Z5_9CAUL|nr:hypothetical protein DJ021_10580 [Phenylobacterium hankyongense]